ncbi:hypothetical protein AXG93_3545s1140 [Marchantia polymorpha subsp. ruderalis]|uniref:Uncharacterized protein n=1 Tax=Marchantia polymorpha subsp. ruderalis TaxID=1480154 RepID=A0A176VVW7_MARPO|nr:hypothetical protein AXG93_3545s1140 [Marchantia polymorpha subsp. ruderalis]
MTGTFAVAFTTGEKASHTLFRNPRFLLHSRAFVRSSRRSRKLLRPSSCQTTAAVEGPGQSNCSGFGRLNVEPVEYALLAADMRNVGPETFRTFTHL